MKDLDKTKEQLINELKELRQEVAEPVVREARSAKRAEPFVGARVEWERTFDVIPDPISVLDRQHRIFWINKTMANRLGIAPEEAEGLTCYECVHGMTKPPSFCPHTKLLADGKEHMEEMHAKRLGGDFITSVSPLHDAKGRVIASIHVARDITKRKRTEKALRQSESELAANSEKLEQLNAALTVLLKRREKDKENLQDTVLVNVKELILPYIEKLKNDHLSPQQATLISIIELNVKEIVSPFATKLSSKFLNLTPTELQVASLVKDGRSSNEIAELMNLSPHTILFHRHNLRSKLGLKQRKVNLRSYLRSLQY
jgi:PAS domain S-box-containing protein